MPLLSKSSSAPQMALIYITVGALILVWTTVRFVYLLNHEPDNPAGNLSYYWCAGFLATGLTFLLIGFGLGHISRSARKAELPPEEVTPEVAQADQTAAARAPMVAPNPASQATPAVPTAPATPAVPAVPATPVRSGNGPVVVSGDVPARS